MEMTIIDKILVGRYRQRMAVIFGVGLAAIAVAAIPSVLKDSPNIPASMLLGAATMNGVMGAFIGFAFSYMRPIGSIIARERIFATRLEKRNE